jgi:hypothetical protein
MENYLLRNLTIKKGENDDKVKYLSVEFQTLRYPAIHAEVEPDIFPVNGDVKFTYLLDKSNVSEYPVQNKFAYTESIKFDQFGLHTTTIVVVDTDANYAESESETLVDNDEDIINVSQHIIPEDE